DRRRRRRGSGRLDQGKLQEAGGRLHRRSDRAARQAHGTCRRHHLRGKGHRAGQVPRPARGRSTHRSGAPRARGDPEVPQGLGDTVTTAREPMTTATEPMTTATEPMTTATEPMTTATEHMTNSRGHHNY